MTADLQVVRHTVLVLLALGTLLGCQGVSSGKQAIPASSNSQPSQLTINPTSISFGNVQIGKNQTQALTLTNLGGSSLTISQVTASGIGFTASKLTLPLTLTTGQSQALKVTFTPQSSGSSSGSLAIANNGSTPTLNVALSGAGTSGGPAPQGILAVNPTSLNFGSVHAGKNLTLLEHLTNTGSANLTLSQATVTGGVFGITGLTLPIVLAPGQSYTFEATFAPQAVGYSRGAISLISDASDPGLTVPVAGTEEPNGQLSVVPTAINFGNVSVGSKAQQTGQLGASGASVTVSSVNGSGSEFTITGIAFPVTIPAGQSANFTATFTPDASGRASGSALFASDASNSPTVQSLTGNGVSALQPRVYLSWTASSSPNVIGYNVYRGTRHGGPYPIKVVSLDPSTTYTDNSVAPGQTYYYVATAVNASNVESRDCNEVKAVIPSP